MSGKNLKESGSGTGSKSSVSDFRLSRQIRRGLDGGFHPLNGLGSIFSFMAKKLDSFTISKLFFLAKLNIMGVTVKI